MRDLPFAPFLVDSLGELSRRIFASPWGKTPAAAGLAFWLRASRVQALAEQAAAEQQLRGVRWLPRGRVFHVTPANVDTMFSYSWALAYLTGNVSRVRLSRRQSALTQGLVALLEEWGDGQDQFFTCDFEDPRIEESSRWCSHRVIWGGDATVEALRGRFLAPTCSERLFPSRFSMAVLRDSAVLELDARALGERSFRDLFEFDQRACSSPQVIFWLGPAAQEARIYWEAALQAEWERRLGTEEAGRGLARLQFVFAEAARTQVQLGRWGPGFTSLSQELGDLSRETPGAGLIRHCALASLDELGEFFADQDQTVVHLGLEPRELDRLVALAAPRGPCRFVGLGQALDFHRVWDGGDLVRDFVREVVVA